jgi:CheY-like chemotaxis protein
LIERAANQEDQLEALVASTESAVRQAEGAVSQGEEVRDPGDLHRVLSGQLERSVAGAAAAKRLLAGAHRQHTEARLLLARIEGDHRRGAPVNTAVLVVDDQDDARDLLAIVLENAGFSVRSATNGLEALITAHDMQPGVIVMDVSMPVLDGLEATRLIKADNATRHARIIAYTGNPSFDDGSAERLFAAVLTKPRAGVVCH